MDPCPARNLMPNCHKRCYLLPQPQHDFALVRRRCQLRKALLNGRLTLRRLMRRFADAGVSYRGGPSRAGHQEA